MRIHPQKGDFTLPHEVNTLRIHLFFVCALPQEVNTTRGKLFFAYTLYSHHINIPSNNISVC